LAAAVSAFRKMMVVIVSVVRVPLDLQLSPVYVRPAVVDAVSVVLPSSLFSQACG